jgi:hypothetical protein
MFLILIWCFLRHSCLQDCRRKEENQEVKHNSSFTVNILKVLRVNTKVEDSLGTNVISVYLTTENILGLFGRLHIWFKFITICLPHNVSWYQYQTCTFYPSNNACCCKITVAAVRL